MCSAYLCNTYILYTYSVHCTVQYLWTPTVSWFFFQFITHPILLSIEFSHIAQTLFPPKLRTCPEVLKVFSELRIKSQPFIESLNKLIKLYCVESIKYKKIFSELQLLIYIFGNSWELLAYEKKVWNSTSFVKLYNNVFLLLHKTSIFRSFFL